MLQNGVESLLKGMMVISTEKGKQICNWMFTNDKLIDERVLCPQTLPA